MKTSFEYLAVTNNHISLSMLRADLSARGIGEQQVLLIAARAIYGDVHNFARVVEFPGEHELRHSSLPRVANFYRESISLVREFFSSGSACGAYIVNVDNLICQEILRLGRRTGIEVSVVVEGLMNFVDATSTLSRRRSTYKRIAATLLRVEYSDPTGHLSGAYDLGVARVVSFSDSGLRAPSERVVLRQWPFKCPAERTPGDSQTCLLLHTGLYELMPAEEYSQFAQLLVAWIRSQAFDHILTKRHPRKTDELLESLLGDDMEYLAPHVPIEEMACDLPTGTVVGWGSTPLVTLRLMRPSLRCIDLGANIYLPAAYGMSTDLCALYRAVGVEIVDL